MLHGEEEQAGVTGAANPSGFFIRLAVVLGIMKYCSAWVMLESSSDCNQKSKMLHAQC